MSRRPLSLVALVLVVAKTTLSAGAATSLVIDGVQAGSFLAWEGGDPRASVGVGSKSADGTVTKQPGSVVWAPLVVQSAFPPAGPLREWLGELCANQSPRKKIVLTDYDATGRATGATEFDGALLTEVRFPSFDAASTAAGSVAFVFAVESSRQIAPPSSTALGATRATAATFRLVVDNMDGTAVTRIGALSIGQKLADDAIGETRSYTTTPGTTASSNLTVTLQRAKSATWRAWFTDFVISGNSSDANEKSGALEFLSGDMKQVVFALRFQNMGILRLSRVNVAPGAPEVDEAELYFEKVSTGMASTAAGTSDSSSQTGSGGTGESASGVSDGKEGATDGSQETSGSGSDTGKEGETSVGSTTTTEGIPALLASQGTATGMLSVGTTADTSGMTAVNVSDRFTSPKATVSDSTTSEPRAGTVAGATSVATTTTTNPADKGTRDPAEFPRVAGLTRVNYTGYFQPTYTQEEAGYTATEGIFEVARRVDEAARSAGWTLAQMAESESSNGRSVTQRWTRPQGEAWVNFLQPQDGPTQVKVSTTLQKPPPG